MIPLPKGEGRALYVPTDARVDAYEPKKKRRRCQCGGRGEWVWKERTKHHWTPGEVICSRCLIYQKLEEQRERIDEFLRKLIVTAAGDPVRLKKLSETVNMVDDPPTLTDQGCWNLAHVVVITAKAGIGGRPKRSVQPIASKEKEDDSSDGSHP